MSSDPLVPDDSIDPSHHWLISEAQFQNFENWPYEKRVRCFADFEGWSTVDQQAILRRILGEIETSDPEELHSLILEAIGDPDSDEEPTDVRELRASRPGTLKSRDFVGGENTDSGDRVGGDGRENGDWMKEGADPLDLARAVLAAAIARLPYSEDREGQRRMCELVLEALKDGEDLAVRAGPLTGKTLAYAVAAAVHAITGHSDKPIVIACPSLPAQDQLMRVLSDVGDALSDRGLGELRYAALKGRNNYLCVERLVNFKDERTCDEEWEAHLDTLLDWGRSTETGDLGEHLGRIPDDLLKQVSGSGCDHERTPSLPTLLSCYSNIQLNRAPECHLLVVNHHKYVWSLKSDNARLPEHDAVIIEEADFLPDVISSVCTRRVAVSDEIIEVIIRLGKAVGLSQALLSDLRDVLDERASGSDGLRAFEMLRRRLQDPGTVLPPDLSLPPNLEALIEEVRDRSDPHYLHLRGQESSLKLCVTPMYPHRWLEQHRPSERALIMCSSTLTSSSQVQQLSSLRRRQPVSEATSAEVYAHQAILYVPKGMPDPTNDPLAYRAKALTDVLALTEAAGGRTLILSATTQDRDDTYDLLKVFEDRLGVSLLRQGDLPPLELLERFRTDDTTVVCAVKQLWWSIDVPGDGLQLVIVDKIPFANPSRPLVWEDDGEAPSDHGDHYAERMLAQAMHRLIRTESDAGVVALLDGRYWDSLAKGRDLLSLAPLKAPIDNIEEAISHLRKSRRK